MKKIVQPIVCAIALAALLGGAASQATPLAELPLKTSVLAKPNVIFAMDDSGSMDWEVLFDTDSGQTYWREDSSTGFGSAWDFVANRPFRTGVTFNPLSYLFPMGTAVGAALYDSTDGNGRAAPPIGQLAWLRSSAFNPLYYNTMVTYPAWSPAYVSSAMRSYSNAPTNAAPSHPGPLSSTAATLNVGADWNSSSTNWSASADNSFTFRVLSGMVLPAGTRVNATTSSSGICSGSLQTLTATTKVPAGASCRASIPYYPATFWQRTVCPAGDTACVAAPDCTVVDPTVDPQSACVNAPDGLGKLRRYEIRSGNTFPSGRSDAQELQNFANWFTYYRKRKLMLAGGMGRALEPITGLRFGVVPLNDRSSFGGTMWDADSTTASSNRYATAGKFYLNSMSAQGTPTRGTIKYIGDIYNNSSKNIVEYSCQRNSMFVVTDGFANDDAPAVPSYNSATYGAAAPYQTTAAGSMADQALAYYTNRLRTDLVAGKVPPGDPARTNPDLNIDLHITTYGITLGARGTLFPTALDPFAVDVFASPPTWPTPVKDGPTMIDDLWHATVNGRGRMFMANDAEAMRQSIQSAFSDIQNQQGSQGSVAVSAVNLDRGDSQAYLASYNPAGWTGDLAANPIAKTTGLVDMTPANQIWSATKLLSARTWSTRTLFSSSGSSGVAFDDANVGAAVLPSGATFTSAQLVDFLRGSSADEGTLFRDRSRTITVGSTTQTLHHLLGPVINAEPVLARDEKMVYIASGEGMLHAFDTVTGKEEWAYAPPDVLAGMGASAARGWVFRTLLDATPVYGKLSGGGKMLIGGLGAAGRSYYALDVSNPKNLGTASAAAQFRWVFPAAGDSTNRALMGYTVGKPVIVKTTATTDRILVTSGYDNGQTIGDGKGRLWVLDTSGNVVKSFVTGAGAVNPGQEAGLAHVSAFKEADGTVRYAYGGDLLGNLWRFDLQKTGTIDIAADLVAVFKDSAAKLQPVTTSPELTTVGGKRIILIGTGRILDIGDFGSSDTQSFYAVADGTTAVTNPRLSSSGMVQQVYTRGGTPELTANAFNWSSDRGWFFDLPAGEQANTDPIVTYGAVAFVTNKNGGSDCSQQSYLYLVDVGTGTKVPGSTSLVGQPISLNATSSRVITLRVVNGEIVGTTHKSDNTVFTQKLPLGQTINPSKNAWKEIRR